MGLKWGGKLHCMVDGNKEDELSVDGIGGMEMVRWEKNVTKDVLGLE